MKIHGTCANCKETVVIDLDKEIKSKEPRELENQTSETQTQVLIEKPVDKPKPEIKIETVIEDFKPNYECPDGNCPDLVHPNKNYRRKPKGKCNNCDQFTKNKDGKCPWCKGTDIEELDPEDLEELGISNPPEVEHIHE